ncbi:universal stress protein [Mycolicibacterium brisbanense]|uniref:Universal stress protein UspA-like protein n=1 Tax=Mycolicibacterium brisbanense TaxID=146020 RepID=A0A124DZU2_9MYCO|nr:universal stress protein [Mycolicibacterium brisbanense]MCV7160154.1 universal stress protein [Mycolicibacterium brisbanense]GAS88414.1 universal stress protein UspA-like protein [Mycolicibacterium brisbanense]
MGQRPNSGSAVVVGIDDSQSAVAAALWSVDEAVGRDIPLRLAYAIDPDQPSSDQRCDSHSVFAMAEIATENAVAAIESTGRPVKVEVEVLIDRPERALRVAAETAAMICVGATGTGRLESGRIGAIPAALAGTTPCPLAIIRQTVDTQQRCVAVELDSSCLDDDPLRLGLEEARLRKAPLRVLTARRSHYTDIHDSCATARGDRLAKADLEHRLSHWRELYPEVDVRAVALHGNTLSYLARNISAIQLLVVARERGSGIREMVAAPGSSALHDAGCSVLICGSGTYSVSETNGHGRKERVAW